MLQVRVSVAWALLLVLGQSACKQPRDGRPVWAFANLRSSSAAIVTEVQKTKEHLKRVALLRAPLAQEDIQFYIDRNVSKRGAFYVVRNEITQDEPSLSTPERPCRYLLEARPEGAAFAAPPAIEFTCLVIDGDVGRVCLRYEAKGMHLKATYCWDGDGWRLLDDRLSVH